ncbi:MAG: diguanylate cyclase [Pseudomonadota bacterium]
MTDNLQPNILLVDDRMENLITLEAILEDCPCELTMATSGNEALSYTLEKDFALVLLDVQMPAMDGFEVAELMRMNKKTKFIPIIFITAINKEQQYVFKGYETGAVDYLFKPIDAFILSSKVDIFIELWLQKQKLKQISNDLIVANKKILIQQEELKNLAIHDHLTNLFQRRWFDEVILKEISSTLRNNTNLTIALLDIDHFKQVNDSYGHQAGDAVLIQLANLLKNKIRLSDSVFRFGGEEFVIIMPKTDLQEAINLCERTRHRVESLQISHDKLQLQVTISIGLAMLCEPEITTPEELIKSADNFLYLAKSNGRNCVSSQLTEIHPHE